MTKKGSPCTNIPDRGHEFCNVHRNTYQELSGNGDSKQPIETKQTYTYIPFVSTTFKGIEDIIGSYSSYYYRFNITWRRMEEIDEEGDLIFEDIPQEIIIGISGGALHDYFVENSQTFDGLRQMMYWILRHKFPQFQRYSIGEINYEEVEFKEIKNETVITLTVYDMANLFSFVNNQDAIFVTLDEAEDEEFKRMTTPTRRDLIILQNLIDAISTQNYREYNNLISSLNPILLHELIRHVPVDDSKLFEPLFYGDNALLFNAKAHNYPYFRNSRTMNRLELAYLEDDAKFRLNKFILSVLMEAIRVNDLNLCKDIAEHIENVILIRYCIEVAKEYNNRGLIPMFEEQIVLLTEESE